MFGIGHMPQILLLLVVALLIFGPGKLPEIGSAFGRGLREFKDATAGKEQLGIPEIARPTPIQPAPVAPPVHADPAVELRSLERVAPRP